MSASPVIEADELARIEASRAQGRRVTVDSVLTTNTVDSVLTTNTVDTTATDQSGRSQYDILTALSAGPTALATDRKGRLDLLSALRSGPEALSVASDHPLASTSAPSRRPSTAASVRTNGRGVDLIQALADGPISSQATPTASARSSFSLPTVSSSASYNPSEATGRSNVPLLDSSKNRPKPSKSWSLRPSDPPKRARNEPTIVAGNPMAPLRRRFMPPRRSSATAGWTSTSAESMFEKQQLVHELLHALADLSACYGPAQGAFVDPLRPRPLTLTVPLDRFRLLASELDQVVDEIIETVPDFQAALGQGNYGPLALPVRPRKAGDGPIPRRPYEAFGPIDARDLEGGWLGRLRRDVEEALVVMIPEEQEPSSTATSAQLLDAGRRRWESYLSSAARSET